MGEQTIVYGRISLKGNIDKSREFIKTLGADDQYPWLRTEMFSIGANERPYYYEEPVIVSGFLQPVNGTLVMGTEANGGCSMKN